MAAKNALMKYCPQCHKPCDDNMAFCDNCGASLNAAPAPQQPSYQNPPQNGYAAPGGYAPYGTPIGSYTSYAAMPRATTMKEFLKLPESKSVKSPLTVVAILCFVFGAFNLLIGFALDSFPASLIDVAILVGCGLGILLANSRIAACILLAYALFGTILNLVRNGQLTGWLIIILGVMAVLYTFKANTLWQQYQQQT